MRLSRFVLRCAVPALLAFGLGACATQPREQVEVGVGTQTPLAFKAADYAALYVPYAMMATAAYTNPSGLNANYCPDATVLSHPARGESARDKEFREKVRHWVIDLNAHGWQCHSGVISSLKCPRKLGPDCRPVGGLEYHVWQRKQGNACREVVIAFRGTDVTDLGDWISNFRWLYRLVPRFDQYAQVQDHISGIVRHLKRECGSTATQFVSAGHSLGGGLAQQAAYADKDGSIHYVYAFDPSPVTGFFDVSELVRSHSTRGLGVDRAYEAGEILALPRLLVENIFPPASCHPRIRMVRFNVLHGLPLTQHSMADLTEQMRIVARAPGVNPRKVDDSLKARSCTEPPPLILSPA
jgi:dienelactone hydrolase